MPECPVCKGKGSYYKCYQIALGRLLAFYPSIVESVDRWKLLDEEPIRHRDSFKNFFRYTEDEMSYRLVWKEVAFLEVSSKETRLRYDETLVTEPYKPFEDYQKVSQAQDLFLIPLCVSCAKAARDKLRLERYELYQLFGVACPCCHYYTLSGRGHFDICPVCFWEDDGIDDRHQVSGPNHITLGEAIANYRAYGACDERAREHVRPPAIDEYPQYHQ